MHQAGLGIVYKNQYYIAYKLEKAGAISIETAVTPDEADLTFSERGWLIYLTGDITSIIRKTEDQRYYLRKTTI